jgi:flavin reductase (DIM6/NTAB) family NADH-FMN oxidoreductase RutF
MTDSPASDLRARFLGGMAQAAATVNIVTTDGPRGRSGVTVSAMSSVSADMDKPVLLVCVHHLSPAAPAILANGVFCVNVLRDDQSYISDSFAGRFKDELPDKFDCVQWTTQVTGAPRVVDPLVAFDCRGKHTVINNSQYWIAPTIVVAQAIKSRFRAFGRNWDFQGKSAEICAIDWKGP